MTEAQKQKFIEKVLNLVEGRLVISVYIKTKLKEMGFVEARIESGEQNKIITGQIKYNFHGFDIAIGTTSRFHNDKRIIMGIKFDWL